MPALLELVELTPELGRMSIAALSVGIAGLTAPRLVGLLRCERAISVRLAPCHRFGRCSDVHIKVVRIGALHLDAVLLCYCCGLQELRILAVFAEGRDERAAQQGRARRLAVWSELGEAGLDKRREPAGVETPVGIALLGE